MKMFLYIKTYSLAMNITKQLREVTKSLGSNRRRIRTLGYLSNLETIGAKTTEMVVQMNHL